jgi:hypothetical protein
VPEDARKARDDAALAEWLHEGLLHCVGTDNDPWAVERVREVQERLNRG